MIENMSVVVFFAFGHAAGRRIARVIESRRIRLPGHRAGAGAIDHVWQIFAAGHLTNMKSRLLIAALRQTVGDQLAVPTRIPPVERDRTILGEQVWIKENAIFAMQSLASIKNRLILLALALRIEIKALARHGSAQNADVEQLL